VFETLHLGLKVKIDEEESTKPPSPAEQESCFDGFSNRGIQDISGP